MWSDGLSALRGRLNEPSDFAQSVFKILSQRNKLLELGCGTALDANFFARNGVHVIATDFTEQAIEDNKKENKLPNLSFEVLDISKAYPYEDATFDCVYACLSLHYFPAEQTKKIFKEISRVLKPVGVLAFRCKSTEKDMFVLNGHIRHFFSIDFAKSLLHGFSVLSLKQTEGVYDSDISNFVDCVARKL